MVVSSVTPPRSRRWPTTWSCRSRTDAQQFEEHLVLGRMIVVGGWHHTGFLELGATPTSMVASPPSSRIMLAGSPTQVSICSAAHQYSSRVSPFHANTGTPLGSETVPCGPTTTAAAAWSWWKMLHDAQRTSAPRPPESR